MSLEEALVPSSSLPLQAGDMALMPGGRRWLLVEPTILAHQGGDVGPIVITAAMVAVAAAV